MSQTQTSLFSAFEQTTHSTSWKVPEELPDLSGVERLSLDTETTGRNPFKDQPVGVSLCYPTDAGPRTLYAPFGHSDGNMDPERVRNWLEWNLTGKEVLFTNAKFDIAILKNWGLDLEELGVRPRDIAFNAALLDDNRRAGLDLETLARTYTDVRKVEFNGDMNRMAEYPSWVVGEYAEGDALATYMVDEATRSLVAREGMTDLLDLENDLIYFVCEIERNGARIDVEKLERWRVEVRDTYELILMTLSKQVGFMIQPGSGEHMLRLFKKFGLTVPPKGHRKGKKKDEPEEEKQGKRSFTEEELLSLKHPAINQVVALRQLESLLSKFLDKFHDGLDGDLLRSQFHQLKSDDYGTISGRFSSSGGGDSFRGYSYNAQQTIKPQLQIKTTGDRWIVRELFIPQEGAEYFACDASQIEYRLFGHFTNATKVVRAYREDPKTDFHQMTMDMILPHKPDIDRDTAKNTSFSRLYGAQAPTFAATAGITVKEAELVLKVYDTIFPEAKTFADRTQNDAKVRGFVSTILARRARFGTHDRFHSAVNRVIQGSAADLMKLKLRRIYRERETLGILKLRQTVHDEQTGDKDPDPKYTKLIEECFAVQEIPLRVPIIWEMKTGQNWRQCK